MVRDKQARNVSEPLAKKTLRQLLHLIALATSKKEVIYPHNIINKF